MYTHTKNATNNAQLAHLHTKQLQALSLSCTINNSALSVFTLLVGGQAEHPVAPRKTYAEL